MVRFKCYFSNLDFDAKEIFLWRVGTCITFTISDLQIVTNQKLFSITTNPFVLYEGIHHHCK